eukprot:Opistho-2@13674
MATSRLFVVALIAALIASSSAALADDFWDLSEFEVKDNANANKDRRNVFNPTATATATATPDITNAFSSEIFSHVSSDVFSTQAPSETTQPAPESTSSSGASSVETTSVAEPTASASSVEAIETATTEASLIFTDVTVVSINSQFTDTATATATMTLTDIFIPSFSPEVTESPTPDVEITSSSSPAAASSRVDDKKTTSSASSSAAPSPSTTRVEPKQEVTTSATSTRVATSTVAAFVRPTSLAGFSPEQLATAVRVSLRGVKASSFKGSAMENSFKSEVAKAANKALSKSRRAVMIAEEDIETPELFIGSDLEKAFKVEAMRAANEAIRSKRASSVVVTVDDIVILFYIDTASGLDLVMLLAVYSADGTPIIISGDVLASAINDSVAALAALGLDVSGVVLNPVDPSNPDGGSPSNPGGSTAASSSKNLAWVAGPVVGGIALVGIAVGGVFYYRKTRTGTYNLERIRIPSDNAIGSHTVKADGTDIEAGPEAPLPGVIAPPTEDMTMATVNDWNGAAA